MLFTLSQPHLGRVRAACPARSRSRMGNRHPGRDHCGQAPRGRPPERFYAVERRIRLDEMELTACTCASAATRPGASTGWTG
ncbi:MAG: hypothetical protein ACLSAH_01565 [Bilophila wadsworthia]